MGSAPIELGNDHRIEFIMEWSNIAQKTESIHPDKEEMDLIRRIGKKADELMDREYDEYEFKG